MPAPQVGGGPTGVEVAAELHDLVKEDVARKFPSVAVSGRLVCPCAAAQTRLGSTGLGRTVQMQARGHACVCVRMCSWERV